MSKTTSQLLRFAGINYTASPNLAHGLRSYAATLAVSEVQHELVPVARMIYRNAESQFFSGRLTPVGELAATPFLPGTRAPDMVTVARHGGFLPAESLVPAPAPVVVPPTPEARFSTRPRPAPNPPRAQAWSSPIARSLGFDPQVVPGWTEFAEAYLQVHLTGLIETAALEAFDLPLPHTVLDRVLKLLGLSSGGGRRMARFGDPTSHGGVLSGGASRTLFGNVPAVRTGDAHTCGQSSHGCNTVSGGNTRILIEGQWATGGNLVTSCGAGLQPAEGDIVMEQDASVEAERPQEVLAEAAAPPEGKYHSLLTEVSKWKDNLERGIEATKEVGETLLKRYPKFDEWIKTKEASIGQFYEKYVAAKVERAKQLEAELLEHHPRVAVAVEELGKFSAAAERSGLKHVPLLGMAAAAEEGYHSRPWETETQRLLDAENAVAAATFTSLPVVDLIDMATLGGASAIYQACYGNTQPLMETADQYRRIGHATAEMAGKVLSNVKDNLNPAKLLRLFPVAPVPEQPNDDDDGIDAEGHLHITIHRAHLDPAPAIGGD